MSRTRILGVSLLASAALVLAGCSNGGDSTDPTQAGTEEQTAQDTAADETAAEATADLTLSDGVVRATVEDNPMTSVFGTLQNSSDEELTIVGLTASVDAESYEIHEVVDGVMQEKEGGITIPAGESHELGPGGDHFMFMELSEPIEAGDAVSMTLELADGSTVELADVPVRTMGAGDEDYGDLGGMDHGDMEDGSEHEH